MNSFDVYGVGANAVILGLDPAKDVSGAALLLGPGAIHSYGLAKKQRDREFFVREGVRLAAEAGKPFICVAEEWDPPRHRRKRTATGEERVEFDQKWTYPTVLGMGAGWGLWLAELLRVDYREQDIIRVKPNTWRDALFGSRRTKDTRTSKALALAFGIHALRLPFQPDLDKALASGEADIAEAACIGVWAFKQSRVAELADKKLKKLSKSP